MRVVLIQVPKLLALAGLAALTLLGAGALFPASSADQAETSPLVGMQLPLARPPLTINALWTGDYQKATESRAAAAMPYRTAIVRAYNQWQWDLFGTSDMAAGSIVRGQNGVLFEKSYIEAHCGIEIRTDVAALPAFARRLRRVQDWFEGRGQHFVYVLAPVKTSWFPGAVPSRYPCATARRDTIYPAARRALTQAGVQFVDGRAALEIQRGKTGYELFPRNGIHWNQLGAAFAARSLVEKLQQQGVPAPPLNWDVAPAPDEVGLDRDLSSLLNLQRPPQGWKAPALTPRPASPPGSARLTLAAVNDSFMDPLSLLLTQAEVFGQVRNFGYLTLSQLEYRSGGATPITADTAAILKDLTMSDVVVLEQVESQTGGAVSLRFLDLVEGEMARRSTVPPRPAS